MIPETKYAKSGNIHIAYQVTGQGPIDLVFVHGWISHIEHLWEEPSVARFLGRLASFSRLILLDKRGTGLSDPVPLDELPTLDERMDDVRAVMDAAGSARAALLGTSEAGAIMTARARCPATCRSWAPTVDIESDVHQVLAHPSRAEVVLAAAADGFGVSRDGGDAEALLHAIEEGWGKGVAFEALVASQTDNQSMRNWWARYQRLAASPGAAVTLLRRAFDTDARAVLPAIGVPTLILHRTGDPFTGIEHGRYLAEHIPGAKYVELVGSDHLFFAEDTDRLLAEMQEFLTGVREANEPDRVLATVLFADVVGSTEHAATLGDRRWHDLLEAYYMLVRAELARFRGREVDTAGDGMFAAFDGPARAIRCAIAIASGVKRLGVAVRVGLHTGECEVIGSKVGGIAVHIGARVAGLARANEVLVSGTVKDLVAGSGMRFDERGTHTLKGVPGEWRLYAVAHERGA